VRKAGGADEEERCGRVAHRREGHGVATPRQRLLREEAGVERKGDAAAGGRSRSGQRCEWLGEVPRKGEIKAGGACLALECRHSMVQQRGRQGHGHGVCALPCRGKRAEAGGSGEVEKEREGEAARWDRL
jgi:hypothetical protein